MAPQSNQKILVVDDEPDIRRLLSLTVERMGYSAETASTIKNAETALSSGTYQLCLTDLKLPDGSGIELVEKIQADSSNTPVIVITAHGSMDTAIKAMKSGAFDFINKPVDLKNLRNLIQSALDTSNQKEVHAEVSDISGISPSTQQLREQIIRVSRSQAPVFIYGESGSGKELVARSIHKLSSRSEHPFIAVNCGAIPNELMESEFFGHKKGSFTGAHQDKPGLFKAAEGGTLLLDEVADLSMDMQVKLLRAIQEKSIRPVGMESEIPIDVRILSATHKNLLELVDEGTFRNDLFYRINVIDISVPPLRDRLEDIPILTDVILEKIARKNQLPVNAIHNDVISHLQGYQFPGNIRELENVLERACALTGGDMITVDDLQFSNSLSRSEPTRPADKTISKESSKEPLASIHYDSSVESLDEYLDKQEKAIILATLEKNRWNRTTAAKILGITFRSLRYRMKKLGIDDE